MRRRGRHLYQPRTRGRHGRERAHLLVRVGQSAQGRRAQCHPDRRMPDQPQADQRQEEGGVTRSISARTHGGHRMRSFVLVCLAVAGGTQMAAPQTPALPAALKPAGLSVYLEVPATFVQIYTCGKNDSGAWAWTFKAPEAALLDTAKKQIGKHYAGPTWEALGGGKVVGAVKANAPAPAAGAIPWVVARLKTGRGSRGVHP